MDLPVHPEYNGVYPQLCKLNYSQIMSVDACNFYCLRNTYK